MVKDISPYSYLSKAENIDISARNQTGRAEEAIPAEKPKQSQFIIPKPTPAPKPKITPTVTEPKNEEKAKPDLEYQNKLEK
jgi:hypothetical protein